MSVCQIVCQIVSYVLGMRNGALRGCVKVTRSGRGNVRWGSTYRKRLRSTSPVSSVPGCRFSRGAGIDQQEVGTKWERSI